MNEVDCSHRLSMRADLPNTRAYGACSTAVSRRGSEHVVLAYKIGLIVTRFLGIIMWPESSLLFAATPTLSYFLCHAGGFRPSRDARAYSALLCHVGFEKFGKIQVIALVALATSYRAAEKQETENISQMKPRKPTVITAASWAINRHSIACTATMRCGEYSAAGGFA
jgi:hypothetical protein